MDKLTKLPASPLDTKKEIEEILKKLNQELA